MDLKACLDAVTYGCCFHDVTYGAGCKSVAANEDRDIALRDDEAEVDPVFANFCYTKFRLLRMFNKLERDELEEILYLVGGFFHNELRY